MTWVHNNNVDATRNIYNDCQLIHASIATDFIQNTRLLQTLLKGMSEMKWVVKEDTIT